MMGRLSELAELDEERRYQAERRLRSSHRAPDHPPSTGPPDRISVPNLTQFPASSQPGLRSPRRHGRSPLRGSLSGRRSPEPNGHRRRAHARRLRHRSWSRGRSVSSSRSRSRGRRRSRSRSRSRSAPRSSHIQRQRGFGLSTFSSEFPDRRLERRRPPVQADRAQLTNILRETMITNRRLDIEQRDMAIHHLRNIAPEDLGKPITLMSEWLNSSQGALQREHQSDEVANQVSSSGLDMFGREPPRQESYEQFKARKLKELATARRSARGVEDLYR